jgi:hypothetical protein
MGRTSVGRGNRRRRKKKKKKKEAYDYRMGVQQFYLLPSGSQFARRKITISDIPNCLNYCIIFIAHNIIYSRGRRFCALNVEHLEFVLKPMYVACFIPVYRKRTLFRTRLRAFFALVSWSCCLSCFSSPTSRGK